MVAKSVLQQQRGYAGIGARSTPPEVLDQMILIGREAAGLFILHSGGADGADSAFEQGCNESSGEKKIFLPWKSFNGNISSYYDPPAEAFRIAESMHPAWAKCTIGVKKLHARNIQQVLGEALNTPVEFLVCWTEDGTPMGGTATAIKLARKNRIPVFNLFNPQDFDKVMDLIKQAKSEQALVKNS